MSDEAEGAAEGAAENQSKLAAEAEAAPKSQVAKDKGSKPEYVPDKFWDADSKQVRVEDLVTSYNEMGKKIRERSDDIRKNVLSEMESEKTANRPESADKYETILSDEFKESLPAGLEFEFNENDPLMSYWRNLAFEQGMSQEQFQEGLQLYIGAKIGEMPDFDAELARLGDYGRERAMHVGQWAKANFSEDTINAMHEFAMTAKGVEALEEIMQRTGEPGFSPEQHSVDPGITLEELRTMQNDPRYWDPNRRDPAFVRKIEQGYAKLVG